MATPKMHADEIVPDTSLIRRLLASQFPHWADFPLEPVRSAGTDNTIYRLGDDLAVRMPRIHWAAAQVDKEFQWLPKFAPHLPLSISVPLAKGDPSEGYPWHWGVYQWLEGENATLARLSDPHQAARELAQFVRALQRIDATGGPLSGDHNSQRGMPLSVRDAPMGAAISASEGLVDIDAVTEVWEDALKIPAWDKSPVWVHGDIQSGNLLAVDGRLSAVIDFGCLGVGDPAVDLIVAWNLFNAETRETFRAALSVDEVTWARGRGWALSIAIIALPYYQHTNPVLAEMARYTIGEVLADYREQNSPQHKLRAGF